MCNAAWMGFPRLFRSRWAALLWSAGILWTAYDVASDAPESQPEPVLNKTTTQPTDATGATFDSRDLAVLANAGD